MVFDVQDKGILCPVPIAMVLSLAHEPTHSPGEPLTTGHTTGTLEHWLLQSRQQ